MYNLIRKGRKLRVFVFRHIYFAIIPTRFQKNCKRQIEKALRDFFFCPFPGKTDK
jgi:hypothetical protein